MRRLTVGGAGGAGGVSPQGPVPASRLKKKVLSTDAQPYLQPLRNFCHGGALCGG